MSTWKICPDTAPTLFAIAPLIPGGAIITGLKTLRIKECDRISIPAQQLRKIGVETDEGPDCSRSPSSNHQNVQSAVPIETHDDHRMAMSFAVLGTKLGNLTDRRSGVCREIVTPGFWERFGKTALRHTTELSEFDSPDFIESRGQKP